jgi:hypothetical protein
MSSRPRLLCPAEEGEDAVLHQAIHVLETDPDEEVELVGLPAIETILK